MKALGRTNLPSVDEPRGPHATGGTGACVWQLAGAETAVAGLKYRPPTRTLLSIILVLLLLLHVSRFLAGHSV